MQPKLRCTPLPTLICYLHFIFCYNIPSGKKVCPRCKGSFTVITKHLAVHGLTEDEIKCTVAGLRKRRSRTIQKGKLRKCPYLECSDADLYPRLDQHLRRKHGLKQSDEEYRKWIKVPNALRSIPDCVENSAKKKQINEFAYKITKENGPYDRFLKSFSGGRYKPYNARQQCYKTSKMISAIQLTDLKQFQEDKYQQRLEKVMTAYVATHKGSSARTQVFAIKTFMNYMQRTLPAAYTCKFSTIHVTLNTWNKSFQKTTAGEKNL